MATAPTGIGPRDSGGVSSTSPRAVDRTAQRSGGSARAGQGPAGAGLRVIRMLPPDTPVESLDRWAPRGSYIDIFV